MGNKFRKEFANVAKIMYGIPVGDVMTVPPMTIYVDDDFSIVEEKFVANRIRYLPVIAHTGELVGIISQKDVYRRVAPRRSPEGQVIFSNEIIIDQDGYYEKESLNKYILNYIMRRDPVSITKEKTLGDAIHAMVTNKIGCIPVVDDRKHVIGVVTRLDVLKLIDAA